MGAGSVQAQRTTKPTTLRRTASEVADAVQKALGAEDASVRVALPDGAGRLRVVAAAGPSLALDQEETLRRRRVFETGRGVATLLGGGRTLAVLPLRVGDETLGVLEFVAPAGTPDDRRDAIVALVRQSGALFKVSQERTESRRSVPAMERLLALVNLLNTATGAVDAMTAFADVSSSHLDVPVAVVRPDRAGAGWFLAAAAGLDTDRTTQLRRDLRSVPAAQPSRASLWELSSTFAVVAGEDPEALALGDCVALVDGSARGDRFFLTAISMLEAALERISRNNGHVGDLDVGIAWTAHELRGPLVGAKAALEYILSSGDPADSLDLLRRTKVELDRLADVVDPLLRVSVGQGELRVESTDLVEITKEAVTLASLDGTDRRVAFTGPSRLPIRADAVQLRSALGNVIGNALAYSPDVSPVDVTLTGQATSATVTVRDRGPGIPAAERSAIFNAFVRGSTTRHRNGSGLGLFIARRIIEAHEGRIWFESEPGRRGTAFHVKLPRRRGRSSQRLGY